MKESTTTIGFITRIAFVVYIICLTVGTYFRIKVLNYKVYLADISSHIIVLLVVTKLIWSSQTTYIDLVFGIIICFIGTFMVGLFVGKSMVENGSNIISKSAPSETFLYKDSTKFNDQFQDSSPSGSDSADLEFLNENISDRNIVTSTLDKSIIPDIANMSFNGQSVKDIQLLSVRTLVTIAGIVDSSMYSSELEYIQISWTKIRSDPMIEVWESPSPQHGVLFHAISRIQTSSTALIQWLTDEGIQTGIESIAFRNEIIQSIDKNNELRKLYVKSGSLHAKKRLFTVLTTADRYDQNMYVISSRSVDLPSSILDEDKNSSRLNKSENGFLKGHLYGSGYIIKPIPNNDTCCDLIFITHLNMLDDSNNKNNRMNAFKTKTLMNAINTIYRNLHIAFYPGWDLLSNQNQLNNNNDINNSNDELASAVTTTSSFSTSITGKQNIDSYKQNHLFIEQQIKDLAKWRSKKCVQQLRLMYHEQLRYRESFMNQNTSSTNNNKTSSTTTTSNNNNTNNNTSNNNKPPPPTTTTTTSNNNKSARLSKSKDEDTGPEFNFLYQRDGVVVLEEFRSDGPVGVVSAFCHIKVSNY